jgi:hypothetical protein
MLTHDFPLRRDLLVRFTLPLDITPDEADRFCEFVRLLPFKQATS